MSLRGKKVLITAGPTWVALDSVRVISNTASGHTGLLLAEQARKKGALVTVLLGPVGECRLPQGCTIKHFSFFDELRDLLSKTLSRKKFDFVIHSAAVADYRPEKVVRGKVVSGITNMVVRLIPTVKLIDKIKKITPLVYLVGFKFEPGISRNDLLREAEKLMARSGCDCVVANTSIRGSYSAYIVSREKTSGILGSKKDMARTLIGLMERL
ncbi:MAG: phosphopantothenoylcysteine decarboxylase [Candidatus Omnitrophica bacterium]|nr:phosphopantothenoylcysteine decarboxylase [Candidatus Omnitrophota bacterium]